MSVDYSALEPGQTISKRTYRLDDETVCDYLAAVGDSSPLQRKADGRGLVPPMALAALSLRGVVQDLDMPGGIIHVGQELEFMGSVTLRSRLNCQATLLQNSVRGDWRFIVVGLNVDDIDGRKSVMAGKTTITLPV